MLLLNQIEVINYPFENNFHHQSIFSDFMVNDEKIKRVESKELLNKNCGKEQFIVHEDEISILDSCDKQVKENDEYRKSTLRRATSVQESTKVNSNDKKPEKKVVRFADALGLDLVKIKLIKNPDKPPRVPKHILKLFRQAAKSGDENGKDDDESNEEDDDDEDHEWFYNEKNPFINKFNENTYINSIIENKYNNSNSSSKIIRTIDGLTTSDYAFRRCNHLNDDNFKISKCEYSLKWKQFFDQPGIKPDFFKNLNEKKVSLETIHLKSHLICGVVRVLNICFNKNVKIRYTTDKWKTFDEINAAYINNSCDGHTDRFSFNLNLENSLARFFNNYQNFYNKYYIEFAIVYETTACGNNKNVDYWDNNSGSNYLIECVNNSSSTQVKNINEILLDLSNNLSAAFV